MFKIIYALGSIFIFVGLAAMMTGEDAPEVFPAPYGELLLKFKWLILVVGVLFSTYGVSGYKKERDEFSKKMKKNNFKKKNFVADQQHNNGLEFVKENNIENKDLALKVDWIPLSTGGFNFKTSKLIKVNESRVEVIRSVGLFLFSGVFILVGVGMPLIIGYSKYKENGFSETMIILLVFGLIFTSAGALMMVFPRPRIFDKRQGWFWVGQKSLDQEQQFMQLKKSARLPEIAAIQVLSEYIPGSKSSYTSWEINLVSKDAQRLNVIDHGNLNSIIEDAQLLSDFLGVPVWENT